MMQKQKNASHTMRENDIRPVELRAGQREAYLKDVVRLLQNSNDFVHVSCPACGAQESRKIFEKYQCTFVTCARCVTIYMNPRPTPEAMASYYQNSENYRFWAKYIFPASEDARKERLYKPWVERVVAACSERGVCRGRLLEVGAGFGGFAHLAQQSGMFEEVIVIEPTPELAAACRKRGLQVHEQRVEEADSGTIGPVDILVAFEMIEHLFAPVDFLLQAWRLLKPGGLLVLSCPNSQGFDIMTLGALSSAVDTEHVNLLNPASMRGMLEAKNFTHIQISTPGKLDAELVRQAALAGDYELQEPLLKKILLEEWDSLGVGFQDFLAQNNLSSHLWAFAQK